MAGDKDGKTEKPTQKKIKDARKDGQFPRSQDFGTWASIAVAISLIPLSVHLTNERLRVMLSKLPAIVNDPSVPRALQVMNDIPMTVMIGAAPMVLASMLAGTIAMAAQGVYPSSKAMKPKFSRMNPLQGIKRMFGLRAAWEALKALLKVAVLAFVVYMTGKNLIPELVGSGTLPLLATVERTSAGIRSMVYAAAAAGLVLALADYSYQRHEVMKQLMMTPKEIKDEYKQQEGDPMLKGAIRQKQMAMARNRMMADVPTANVILTNPTHLSIALRYEAGKGAPKVVAKGSGTVAMAIREIARENRVPIVEDKPLARALFRVCEVGEEIPAELYMAVARILAFVMQAGKPGRNAGTRKPPTLTPVPEVLPSRSELSSRRRREISEARHRAR
ncbi:EscU/YscU/HrcU family type III secretion system export apparatus switch protein [Kineosporia sp. NBRC 101731]|uniref:EscU/YscU/HrcU family type III secretion system export apparatus switch protein n=1 Tax=Kineosporia sp. NBRC 101731 TaxID=3032199 RepID=UPI0024A0B717|nr:EscU/YscU/HrcU family type III secretion system export apparatus switch protein [Kineosporia sp. NBRC 101731]GLY26997.1 flagellar biosynthetic protein FlhB [Kineosporia sp. NBRC 101731]